jgi:dCTP deaminase
VSVLSREEIEGLLALGPKDPKSIVMTPLLRPELAFDMDSVDVRLGCHFLLPRAWQQPFFCPGDASSSSLHLGAYVPLGKYLVVPAHQTVLGATLEFIKLPNNVSGEILTKSSVARTFVLVETAPWIHPGYRGCLTLEIANVSNTPVLLYPGRPIGQLIFMWVSPPHKDQQLKRSYGPVYPEPPKLRSPEDDLRAIGVTDTWIIPFPKKKSTP